MARGCVKAAPLRARALTTIVGVALRHTVLTRCWYTATASIPAANPGAELTKREPGPANARTIATRTAARPACVCKGSLGAARRQGLDDGAVSACREDGLPGTTSKAPFGAPSSFRCICGGFAAPRVGLEPTTLRLTAGCSAN